MPFDQPLPQDVTNLLTLADALEGDMPPGFSWNFETVHMQTPCGTVGCALGLAREIGLIKEKPDLWRPDEVCRVFGLPDNLVLRVFSTPTAYGFPIGHFECVTPQMVAAKLRAIAAEKMGA